MNGDVSAGCDNPRECPMHADTMPALMGLRSHTFKEKAEGVTIEGGFIARTTTLRLLSSPLSLKVVF